MIFRFGETFWEALVSLSVEGREGRRGDRAFLEAVLAHTAKALRLEFKELIWGLSALLRQSAHEQAGYPVIAGVIAELMLRPGLGEKVLTTPQEKEVRKKRSVHSRLYLIRQYLKEGISDHLPRASSLAYYSEELKKILQGSTEAIKELLDILSTKKVQRERLLEIITEPVAIRIIQHVSPGKTDFIKDTVTTLKWMRSELGTQPGALPVWGMILGVWLDSRGTMFNLRSFLQRIIKEGAASTSIAYVDYLQDLLELVRSMGNYYLTGNALPLWIETIEEALEIEGIEIISTAEVAIQSKPTTPQEEKPYRKLWDVEERVYDFSASYHIPNAGLIIISSYIGRYFSVLGVTEEGEFKDREAHERAVFLLQYLTNGETAPKEEDLVLNKVLCGFMPDEVLTTTEIEVTDHEAEMTKGMLEAVIGYWTALEDTSVETLQETFLDRPGVLSVTEEFWHLKVDWQAYDLLLRTLPWGFNPVNFSWMDKLMKVVWEE